ncbi:MAG: UDP-N-acetylmuramoyl-L-alanyl-D-glutamate--2,6-diaminopimelate ligase [bacterium]|nr:UDP-N-acetylmuramoyl-L-alanyl-D-glutamate--2,6-diaminopimelate ligase [bacterium]
MAVSLADLAAVFPGAKLLGDGKEIVTAVTADSREAGPGVLFVAVRGTGGDGHGFLDAAVAAGCAAVAVMDPQAADGIQDRVNCLLLDDTRPAPALAARRLHGEPDTKLRTAAVTGTNGKTTVSYLLQAMLGILDGPCGLLGTIRYDDGEVCETAPLTTPGGPVLHAWLARMVDTGCRSVAMELSSHALAQDRAAGLGLDVAIMTNLGRDHLDYHATADGYLAAKARILELLRPGGVLVLNAADPVLSTLATGDHPVVRFAAERAAGPVDLQVTDARLGLTGTRLELDWRDTALELDSPLVGRFNVENLTAALAAGLALGHDAEACLQALSRLDQVPGRLERFDLPRGGLAVVDYAHTHDALGAVLAACDELTDGVLLAVFGCGGDRDRGKRPLMGQVAALGADRVWITNDNPRGEDPEVIAAAVLAGHDGVASPRSTGCRVVLDRPAAIGQALAAAGNGDLVVVAGKGHEDYQLVGDEVLHLDDREIIRHWIEENAP